MSPDLPLRRFTQRNAALERGGMLDEVEIAYLTLGTLAADGRNAVLVTHGYTSGPDMILPEASAAEGSWAALIGPGRAIDTDRLFVVCPNMLGSPYGSTNASSIDPVTGRPYGSRFPEITVGDIVQGQRALLDHLGVTHLVAVIGPSLGGVQAFQWGVDYPDFMDALIPVLAAPSMKEAADPAGVAARLAQDPAWNGGDYYPAKLTETLKPMRIGTLSAYGANAVLAADFPDDAARAAEIDRLAQEWAETFDPNALLVLMKAVSHFDVTGRLGEIRARVLYVLSRTDRLFPPSLAETVMPALAAAGVDATYFEIDSEHGHFASGTDAAKWEPTLRVFLASISGDAR